MVKAGGLGVMKHARVLTEAYEGEEQCEEERVGEHGVISSAFIRLVESFRINTMGINFGDSLKFPRLIQRSIPHKRNDRWYGNWLLP